MRMKRSFLIFLHGSGDSGPNLSSFLHYVTLEQFNHKSFANVLQDIGVDFQCPTAKSKPYSPLSGESSNVWFDRQPNFLRYGIEDLHEDKVGIDNSIDEVRILRVNNSITF